MRTPTFSVEVITLPVSDRKDVGHATVALWKNRRQLFPYWIVEELPVIRPQS